MPEITWLISRCLICNKEIEYPEGARKPVICIRARCTWEWGHNPKYWEARLKEAHRDNSNKTP